MLYLKHIILVFSVSFFVSVQGISQEIQEMMDMLHNTCVGEVGVDEGLIMEARKGNFIDDEKLKCYMRCLLIQVATMDDDGIIDVEAMLAMMPDDVPDAAKDALTKAARTCGTKVGANHCDNAFLTNKCWQEIAKEYYFVV